MLVVAKRALVGRWGQLDLLQREQHIFLAYSNRPSEDVLVSLVIFVRIGRNQVRI